MYDLFPFFFVPFQMVIQLAARRLVDYWEYRYTLFGPKNFFRPLTIEVLKDDIAALSVGLFRIVPKKDKSGRVIIFFDPSRHEPLKYSWESMVSILRLCSYCHLGSNLILVLTNCAHFPFFLNFS